MYHYFGVSLLIDCHWGHAIVTIVALLQTMQCNNWEPRVVIDSCSYQHKIMFQDTVHHKACLYHYKGHIIQSLMPMKHLRK